MASFGREAGKVALRIPIPVVGGLLRAGIRAGVRAADEKGKDKEVLGERKLPPGPVITKYPSQYTSSSHSSSSEYGPILPPSPVPLKVIAQINNLEGYILPISLDVPPFTRPKGLMYQWNHMIIENERIQRKEYEEMMSRAIGSDPDLELRRRWAAEDTLWIVLMNKGQGELVEVVVDAGTWEWTYGR